MAGSGGDYFADLTVPPDFIFDDAIYFTEALLLSAAENEDHLDAQLVMAAQLSDIEQPYKILALQDPALEPKPECEPPLPTILASCSALSLQSAHRSSASIRSQGTQSTGYTSQLSSRTSHDHVTSDQSPAHRKTLSFSRASLSIDRSKYLKEPFLRAYGPSRNSTSSSSGATSVFSTSPSTRERAMRKSSKRASALFSKFKRTSSAGSKPYRDPNPGEEVDTVIVGQPMAFPSPDLDSLRDSGYSEDDASSFDLPRSADMRSLTMAAFLSVPDVTQTDDEPINGDSMECENFQSLRNEQREQYQRISSFELNQRKALAVHQHWTLKRVEARFQTLKDDAKERHPLELERLDEFQLNAEHELRKAQALETQNVATALKHMTGYCSGAPLGSAPAHDVTAEDRKKLERQRRLQQKLPNKHESQINVLRAKQERDIKNKLEKHKHTLEQLEKAMHHELKQEEVHHAKDRVRLESLIQKRRARIMKRWDLRYEMWRKDWEKQNSKALPGRIPQETWPENADAGSLIHSTSALSIYNGALAGLLMELGNKTFESRIHSGVLQSTTS